MRSSLWTAAALGLMCVVPLAVASAGPIELPELSDLTNPEPQGIEHEVREFAAAAQQAAGLDDSQPPIEPISPDAPAPEGWMTPLALGGLAALGAIGIAAGTFYMGGARFVTPAEVLQNDVRQQIYGYLKDRVGANLKQVTDDLSLTTTNAIWHLRKLEEAGLIHSRRFNGYKVFYPADGGVEARRLSLGKTALANENAQEVFEHVVTNPGSHQREIARALGVNHGTVRWHLKKLMSAELIVETRKGKASNYAPTPMGLQALQEVVTSRAAANASPDRATRLPFAA